MSIIQSLKDRSLLSAAELPVAEYVLEHRDQVLSMPIRALAEASCSSPSSVLRLCRKVGASGYQDFKIRLAAEMERRAQDAVDVDYDFPVSRNDSVAELAGKLSKISCEAIVETTRLLEGDSVRRAAELVMGAERVALFAEGDTSARLMGFGNQIMKLGLPVIVPPLDGEADMLAATLTAKDVAVVASYGGEGRVLVANVAVARRAGAAVVAVTSDPESHIGRLADVVLRVMRGEDNALRISPIASQMAVAHALNVLYGRIYQCDYLRFTRMRLGEERLFIDSRYRKGDKG